jgi:hypothetical protein
MLRFQKPKGSVSRVLMSCPKAVLGSTLPPLLKGQVEATQRQLVDKRARS